MLGRTWQSSQLSSSVGVPGRAPFLEGPKQGVPGRGSGGASSLRSPRLSPFPPVCDPTEAQLPSGVQTSVGGCEAARGTLHTAVSCAFGKQGTSRPRDALILQGFL